MERGSFSRWAATESSLQRRRTRRAFSSSVARVFSRTELKERALLRTERD